MQGIWRDFCVSDTYEPGSVMKPFTIAAGLESGKLPGNETYVCGGYGKVKTLTKRINCKVNRTHVLSDRLQEHRTLAAIS